ncbi:MAG: DUF3727 domain-containing protein [Spirulina sp. SIO3F2]|nr:DUF3727 domain-containing protein [Spirulina sp. SIO3F2]
MPSSSFSPDRDPSIPDSVTLLDEAGRSLDCSVEHSFRQNGVNYLLLLPINAPVTIIAWDSDEEDADATWIEESEAIEAVFANAKAVLAEQNLTLNYAAYTLTVSGALPEVDEENLLTLEIETEGDGIESEQFQFLTHFYHQGQEYEIYTPLDPLLLFARQLPNQRIELLSVEEVQLLQPYLRDVLIQELEQEDESASP